MYYCLNCDLPLMYCVEFCSDSCEKEWMENNREICAVCGMATWTATVVNSKILCQVCVNKPWMLERIPEGGC